MTRVHEGRPQVVPDAVALVIYYGHVQQDNASRSTPMTTPWYTAQYGSFPSQQYDQQRLRHNVGLHVYSCHAHALYGRFPSRSTRPTSSPNSLRSVLCVDRTFNLSNLYLTVIVFKNNTVARKSSHEPPLLIRPMTNTAHFGEPFLVREIYSWCHSSPNTMFPSLIGMGSHKTSKRNCSKPFDKKTFHFICNKINVWRLVFRLPW